MFGGRCVALGAVALALSAAGPTEAGSYVYRWLRYPGSINTIANGLSNDNTVVGSFRDAAGDVHGFVWFEGKYARVDAAGAVTTAQGGGTILYGINQRGVAAGTYTLADGSSQLFTYTIKTGAQTKVAFPTLPRAFIGSAYINDEGTVTGAVRGVNVRGNYTGPFGYIARGNTARILARPAGVQTYYEATGINDAGLVIGQYDYGNSFTFKSGKSSDYFAGPSQASATLVFVSYDGSLGGGYADHGFVQSGQTFTTFDYPGATGTSVDGVKGRGDVVGSYQSLRQFGNFVLSGGTYHGLVFPLAGWTAPQVFKVNAGGSFLGTTYTPKQGARADFIVGCAADQIPCTQ